MLIGCGRTAVFVGEERMLYGFEERSWFSPAYLAHLESAYGLRYQPCDGMRYAWESDYQAAVQAHNEAVWQQLARVRGEEVRARVDARFPFKGRHSGRSGTHRTVPIRDGDRRVRD